MIALLHAGPAAAAPIATYACPVFGEPSVAPASLTVTVRRSPAGAGSAEGLVTVEIQSTDERYPPLDAVPAKRLQLISGALVAVMRQGAPGGGPPGPFARRTGYQLTLPQEGDPSNGLLVYLADGPGPSFEAPSLQPFAAGVCRLQPKEAVR